jgi:hypothetical protein
VDLIISLMEYAQSRYSLVLLMVFLLTFTKSCAVISLLIPGTSGLLLFGTLASASVGHFVNVDERQPRRHRRILALVADGLPLPAPSASYPLA